MCASLLRGTPVYVRRGAETIALVPEVAVTSRSHKSKPEVTAIQPSAVYVIDGSGVTRLAPGSGVKGQSKLVLLSLLLGPVLYLWARWSRKNV